jgi:hypothetical protein
MRRHSERPSMDTLKQEQRSLSRNHPRIGYNRTPTLRDSEIRLLIEKYPPAVTKANPFNTQEHKIESKLIAKTSEKLLAYDNSRSFNKQTELKQKLERLRADMHLLTSETLEHIDFADSKHIKKLYNYQLASMREKKEIQEEALGEFLYNSKRIDSFLQSMGRQAEEGMKYGAVLRRQKKRKLALLYQNVKQ